MNRNGVDNFDEISRLDFQIQGVGEPTLCSPLKNVNFVDDKAGISYFNDSATLSKALKKGVELPYFKAAGPRRKIMFDPAWTRVAIVTCGGLCPGLNDVVKALVNTLYNSYGVRHVSGIRYGYRGLVSKYGLEPMPLNPEVVDAIHENGGSILGSSRGQQDTEEIVRALHRMNINILFCIGGDGTLRGAGEIADMILAKGLPISVIGVPKTIDNDIAFTEKTFGFETAVYTAAPVLSNAHEEAKGAYNGIGMVRLMGRDSGFIAAYAALANSVANFCLIPEVPFQLDGPHGFLRALETRLRKKQHAVVVVAEGAGQDLFKERKNVKDASGNLLHQDIGIFLKAQIDEYMKAQGLEHTVKYFDPSYIIRSVPARGTDAIFCLHLAENAVHAAMAGKTNMVVGHWHGQFTHVPIALATSERRKIHPNSQLWRSVLSVTRQAEYWEHRVDECGG
jgi:6-phosphofructokinase 1